MKTGEFMEEEQELSCVSGWVVLAFFILLGILLTFLPIRIIGGAAIFAALIVAVGCKGFFILQPNQAIVATFFGNYVGSLKEPGFFWMNPFNGSSKISMKVSNYSTPQLKVNDKTGNPIEVAAVITWRVSDTARAAFGVENYEEYLRIQSESSLRKVVNDFSYDEQEGVSLRKNTEEVTEKIKDTLQRQCQSAGVSVLDARISHLAYAPEIAQVMLRKQQAEAIVQARQKIVDGAVLMVESVLLHIKEKELANYENADRVQLINNLMTVLVSESEAHPVIQLGSGSRHETHQS